MEWYLLKSAACLCVFYVFYKGLLENSSIHAFKRVYLLVGLVLSFLIPLFTFTTYVEIPMVETPLATAVLSSEFSVVSSEEKINYLPYILWSVYGTGVLFFGMRFGLNLSCIIRKIRRNPKVDRQHLFHVLLAEPIIPHTFFNHIFFNKAKYDANEIPKEVFWHEETHAKQKHSLDIILLEVLQIFFWFNPFLYLIKKAVKLNHEFLADQSVLNRAVPTKKYQQVVLAFSSNVQTPSMAHSINYSSIKKRFTVMKNQTSKKSLWLRCLLIVPLVSLTLYGFSNSKTVTTFSEITSEELPPQATNEVQHTFDTGIASEEKATPEQLAAYNKMAAYWNSRFEKNPAKRTMPLSELKKLETIYSVMTPVQQKESHPFPECTPSLQEDYAQQYLQGAARNHKKAFVLMITVNKLMLNGKPTHPETLRRDLNALTKNWSATEYAEAHPSILIASSSKEFIQKANQAFKTSNFSKATNMELQSIKTLTTAPQQKATPEQLAEYNSLAKKYNAMDRNSMTIYKKEADRLTYLYGLMSTAQRKKAEPFPNLPKPPKTPVPPMPPTPPASVSGLVDVVPPAPPHAPDSPQITVYKTENISTAEIEKGLRNLNQKETTYYINGAVVSLEKAVDFVSSTEHYDFFISESKNKQLGAHLTTGKNNNLQGIVLPPPPPIVSTDPLDHVIRMAKENAAFLYHGKRISSDKAIELVKENRELNISTQTFKNSNPIVNISKEGIKVED